MSPLHFLPLTDHRTRKRKWVNLASVQSIQRGELSPQHGNRPIAVLVFTNDALDLAVSDPNDIAALARALGTSVDELMKEQ
jgi:hypothetical protein